MTPEYNRCWVFETAFARINRSDGSSVRKASHNNTLLTFVLRASNFPRLLTNRVACPIGKRAQASKRHANLSLSDGTVSCRLSGKLGNKKQHRFFSLQQVRRGICEAGSEPFGLMLRFHHLEQTELGLGGLPILGRVDILNTQAAKPHRASFWP